MKRILLTVLAVTTLAACTKQITPEERISQIDTYFKEQPMTYADALAKIDADRRLDFLTLKLSKDLKAKDIWSVGEDGYASVVGELRGKNHGKDGDISIVSAPVDDPVACAAVLEAMRAFKKIGIQHKNNIRVLFYGQGKDDEDRTGLALVSSEFSGENELISFATDVNSMGLYPKRTFVLEEQPMFVEKMVKVIPPYIAPLGPCEVKQGVFPPAWDLRAPAYRYSVEEGTLARDAAQLTAFLFLVN